ETLFSRLKPLRQKLLEHRSKRVPPGRDDKVLTSWNALMISAFVDGYRVTRNSSYLERARKATNFITKNLYKKGHLLRTWGRGRSKLNAYLDDYAYLIQALLDLAAVDFDRHWLDTAQALMNTVQDK